MNQTDIKEFCKSFFVGTGCHIVEEGPGHLAAKLTIDTDKDLMNRPFFWVYAEKCGIKAEPLTLSLIFDEKEVPESFKGESVQYGSARLHQIMNAAAKRGNFTRLYQQDDAIHSANRYAAPLIPWLGLQYNVQFVCDQKRNEIHSVGVNLFSGHVLNDFLDKINSFTLVTKVPAYRHLLQGNLQMNHGVERAELILKQYLDRVDMTWANDANERLEDELYILKSFYGEEKPDEWEQRHQELVHLYSPRVQVDLINCGLFYLSNGAISS